MYVARYLLDIEEFMDAENGEALLARAFLCVDEERREKAQRMRPGRAQAASLGAGLLLQAAARKVIEAAGVEAPAGRHGAVPKSMWNTDSAEGTQTESGLAAVPEHRQNGKAAAADGRTGRCEEAPGHGRDMEAETADIAGDSPEETPGDGQNGETDREDLPRDVGAGASCASGAAGGMAASDMAVEPEEREQESDEQEPGEQESGDGNPGTAEGNDKIKRYSVNKLLELLENKPPIPLAYRYGENGKPYFRDLPFYFNLSHSGDYVFCAISTEEMGTDIQQHCGKDVEKLAGRFFSGRETAALERAGTGREGLFYRLWARKEAYGKLTGKGIVWALGVDFLPVEAVSSENGSSSGETYVSPGTDLTGGDMPLPETDSGDNEAWMSETSVLPEGRCLLWEEWCGLEGYSIALCRYG